MFSQTNSAGKQLIHKQLEMHGWVLTNFATDALVVKHQAISSHSANYIFIVLAQFHIKYYSYSEQYYKMKLLPEKNNLLVLGLRAKTSWNWLQAPAFIILQFCYLDGWINLGTISLKVYEFINQMLWKFSLLQFWFLWSNQVIIWHIMAIQQLWYVSNWVLIESLFFLCKIDVYLHKIWFLSS